MANGRISIDRILSRLDEFLHKNDYASAERHLLYWLSEAKSGGDVHTELFVRNELMGLYRKLSKESEALLCVSEALEKIEKENISHQVGAATTFLNAATVYKAFGRAEESLPLFLRAREVYERELAPDDGRLGGLYNNMALTLVDLGRFCEANELYAVAIEVMKKTPNGALEVAITLLNMATAAEKEEGLLEADGRIQSLLDEAEKLIDAYEPKDGYYAFVCEKCASVFSYYGRFFFAGELSERARRIYEGT